MGTVLQGKTDVFASVVSILIIHFDSEKVLCVPAESEAHLKKRKKYIDSVSNR